MGFAKASKTLFRQQVTKIGHPFRVLSGAQGASQEGDTATPFVFRGSGMCFSRAKVGAGACLTCSRLSSKVSPTGSEGASCNRSSLRSAGRADYFMQNMM